MKFRYSVLVIFAVAMSLILGCGGGSHRRRGTDIDEVVQSYFLANDLPSMQDAVNRIDTLTLKGPYSVYATPLDYRTWLAEQCLFDKRYGIPATVGDVLEAWRASPDSSFSTPTDQFIAALQTDIQASLANADDPDSSLLIFAVKVARVQNSGETTIQTTTRCDAVLARMLAMWSIEKFSRGSPATGIRGSVECEACIAAEIVKCNVAFNGQVEALAQTRDAAKVSAEKTFRKGLISANERDQQQKAAEDAFDSGKKAAEEQQATCKSQAPNKCQQACHQQ
ncbi:MAG: hypothetical protein ACO1SV_19430 [Fimbriimonas sp.]